MNSEVVNVKVKYIRPIYDNLKEWSEDSKNTYIGRRGIVFIKQPDGTKKRYPEKDSIWANPFKINATTTRDQVVEKYEIYIRKKIRKDGLKDELLALKGQKLGCWCHPEACHGDVLVKLIDE